MFKRILAGILSAVIVFSSLSPVVNAVEMTETVQEEVTVKEKSEEEIVEVESTEEEEELETEVEAQPESEVEEEEILEEILSLEEVTEAIAYETGTEGERTVVKEGKCGENITWTLYSDGELVISGSGAMDVGAEEYGDYDAYPWYQSRSGITKVVFNEGITSIGKYAFYDYYDYLEELILPDTLTNIESSAFYGCGRLSSIEFPDSLTNIGESAFGNCEGLSNIEFPNSLTNIGESAFISCEGLKSIVFSENLTSIGESAFWNCDGLSSIEFSENLTSIGEEAFGDCDGLSSVILPKSLTSIGSRAFSSEYLESVQYTGNWKEWEALRFSSDLYCGIYDYEVTVVYDFCYKPNGSNTVMITGATAGGIGGVVQIPETIGGYTVTAIAEKAFANNQTIQILDIPSSIIVIENQAFYNTAIRKLTLHKGIQRIEDNAFYNALGYWGSNDSYYMEELVLPEGLQIIGKYAFRESRMNGKIVVPSSVTSIGESAFDIDDEILYKGSAQQWIDIYNADTTQYPPRSKVTYEEDGPGFIKKIGVDQSISYRLFSWTDAEGKIIVPSEFNGMPVTGIDSFAFQENTNIISVTIPESVTSIEWATFSGCSNLEKVEIDAPINSIPSSMFYECINLKEVYLPHTITAISNDAFYQCNSLEKIYYDSKYNWDKVSISSGNGAMGYADIEFLHDWGYEFVEEWNGSQRYLASCRIIGKKEIGENLDIPNDFHGIPVKYIGYDDYNTQNGLFQGNQDVKIVSIPENVEYIYKNTFKGCANLVEITLPKNLKEIGESAFEGCISLRDIVFPNEMEYIGMSAFKGCTSLEKIVLPKEMESLGSSAFEGCTNFTEIVLPDKIKYDVGDHIFAGCTSLESITIPKYVRAGDHMFEGCTSLERIVVASDYDEYFGCHAFAGCKNVKEIIMPTNRFDTGCNYVGCSHLSWDEVRESIFEDVPRNVKVKVAKNSAPYYEMVELGFTNLSVAIVLQNITLPSTVSVELGKEKTLSVTKVPTNANDTLNLEWTSVDETIASVDANGVITGHRMGSVQITVKDLNSGKTAKTTVQVVLPAKSKITVKTEPVIDTIGLQKGQSVTMQIFATGLDIVEPLDPALFTFTSSDNTIATVDENGVITSVYKGTKSLNVKITAALKNDPTSRKVYLSVKAIPVQAEQILYYLSEEFEAIGDTYVVPKLKVKDADYTIQVYAQTLNSEEEGIVASLKWTTSNSKVATVSKDGLITVKKNADGIAKITASVNDLKKATVSFEIDVRDYSPRLAANTVTLNTNTFNGAQVQMYPVYGASVTEVRLEGNESFDATYIQKDGIHTLNVVADGVVKNGTYKLKLISTIEGIGEYSQAFNVKVANSVPKITVKQKSAFNLFYSDSEAVVSVTAKNAVVSNVELIDTETFQGVFDIDMQELIISYGDKDSKLDKKATIAIELEDYRNPITKTLNINAKETKPTLAVSRKSTSLSALSTNGIPLQITNKTLKRAIDWDTDHCNVTVADASVDYVTTTHEGVNLTILPTLYNGYKFANGKTSHSAKLEIQGENWLKPIVVTHSISIVTKYPTIKAKQSTLTLNSLFGNEVETILVPSLSNCPVPFDYEIIATKDRDDYKKIKLEVVDEWKLKVSFEDPDNLPAKGSYKYDVIAKIAGYDAEESIKTTVTIKVAESKPKVTLEKSSISLNKMISDQIDFAAKITAGYEITDMKISNATGNVLGEEQLAVAFNPETGRVHVEILDGSIANKTYKYNLTPTVKMDGIEKEVPINPVVLSVKVYGNNASISATGKGSIDLVTREAGILYTITGGKNFNYHVDDIEYVTLVGANAELFDIEVLEANAKGQPQIKVKAKESVDFSTAVTYKYKLAAKINYLEKKVESAEFKIKVKQSALSLKAQGDLTVYQSVKNGKISVEVVKPVDAKVKEMQILETKATTVPKDALSYELEKKADGSYVLNYQVTNPGKLKANAGYKLSFAVIPEGKASNKTAQTFTVTLKVKR